MPLPLDGPSESVEHKGREPAPAPTFTPGINLGRERFAATDSLGHLWVVDCDSGTMKRVKIETA